jgi:mono/diheme cytochrome c family protein
MSSNDSQLEHRTNSWMIAGLVLMVIGLLAFPIYRFSEPAARAAADETAQANLASAGDGLWSATCASCHGSYGQGVDAPALNSTQFLTIATDEQIFSIASSGVPGTEMSAYSQQFGGPLTEEQIASLVACVRSWEKTAPDRPDWRDMLNAPAGGHDEGGAGGGHDEAPSDHDEDGAEDHDEAASTDGPPACGPGYDAAAFADHDEDGTADHAEEGVVGDHVEDGDPDADGHDEAPADDHAEDGDPDADGHDEAPADDHAEDGDADADGHDEATEDHADTSG